MVMSTPTTVMPTPTGSSVAPAVAWTWCASAAVVPTFVRPTAATRGLGFATAMSGGFNKTGGFNNTGDFNESNDNVIATRRPMNPPNRRSG
jgi:hypothetical protein